MSVKEAVNVNIPEWKVSLAKKYFKQEEKNTTSRVSSASEAGIFSKYFIGVYRRKPHLWGG